MWVGLIQLYDFRQAQETHRKRKMQNESKCFHRDSNQQQFDP